MKQLFVPYEIALKLKEKGFDEPCFAVIYSDGQLVEQLYEKLLLSPREDFCVSAPLYQQLVDWFREKHTINIFPNAHYKTDNSVAGYLFDVYDQKEKYNTHKGSSESEDYYEALKYAIEKALELI